MLTVWEINGDNTIVKADSKKEAPDKQSIGTTS